MFWYQLDPEWVLLGDTWANVNNLVSDPGGEISVRTSGTGAFRGGPTNVVGYSYTEGSTPLVPGDESGARTTGAAGQNGGSGVVRVRWVA